MDEVSETGRPQRPEAQSNREPEGASGENAGLFLTARRALLASLGAVAMTFEEANELLARLVERGELAEADITRFVNDYVSRNSVQEEKANVTRLAPVDRATLALADSVEVILERLNVPTHADIEELSRKISILNEKVTLLKQRGGQLPASANSLPLVRIDGENPTATAANGET